MQKFQVSFHLVIKIVFLYFFVLSKISTMSMPYWYKQKKQKHPTRQVLKGKYLYTSVFVFFSSNFRVVPNQKGERDTNHCLFGRVRLLKSREILKSFPQISQIHVALQQKRCCVQLSWTTNYPSKWQFQAFTTYGTVPYGPLNPTSDSSLNRVLKRAGKQFLMIFHRNGEKGAGKKKFFLN